MMGLVQLALPVVVISAFIQFKLNYKQKGYLFKIPIVISATILSLFIGHMAGGVMGFYAAAFCDLLLYPIMVLMKRAYERRGRKMLAKQQELGSGRSNQGTQPVAVG